MSEMKISDELLSNYEDYYQSGDSEWRRIGAIDKANNILDLCSNFSISSVLEIGAGEGAVLKRLSELNFSKLYYAIEISASGVSTIKNKKIPNLEECTLFDGYNIPYNDKMFDLAILSHVVEHVEYPRRLIYEAKRVAKYVFIEVPLEDSLKLPDDFVLDRVGHINFYSPKTIRRLVQTCSLEVIEQTTTNPSKSAYTYHRGKVGMFNYYIKKYLLKLFPKFSTLIFSYHGSIISQSIKK